MHRSRGYGLGIMLLGIVTFLRGSRVPTHSRVAMVAGVLFMVVGAVYAARARRRAESPPDA